MLLIDLKIALKALRATRIRTALTMLGIIIGVASVTVVMALGEGAKEKIRSEVQQLGTNLITVRPGKINRDEHGNIANVNILAALSSSTLTEQDFDTITKLPNITSAAPVMPITGSITDIHNKESLNTTIIATSNEAPTALGIEIRNGEFLSNMTNRETVVLGQELAVELLGADNAVGNKVKLRGQEFTVVGILQPFNTGTLGNISTLYNYNRTAFIPLDAGKAFNHGLAQIQQINARGAKDSDNKQLSATIHQQILANHGGEEDFSVLLPEETLQVTDSLLRIVTLFTTAIASISLIVGGVGIMNIMLVSVTERTREIGVRKAIGATNAQIMRQFLIEALLMSTIGGLIGAIAAYAIAFGIGTLVGFMPVVTWQIIALVAGVSVVTGVLFGITPAYKASRKDPIEALRNFQ